jgi:signal transduction histidine kinase
MMAGKAVAALADDNLMFKLAHDVNSYLRTIVTRIELAQNSSTACLGEEEQMWLGEAASAARDISGLMSAMVAYSDAEAEDGSQRLGLLLRGVVNDLHSKLAACGGEVDVRNSSDSSVPLGLKKVLKELVTNSCRFRAADRPLRICIAVRREDTEIEVMVTDNGMGVEREFLEKIFAPFFRLHSRDEIPGHGLGLAMCRKVAAGWGGSIVAEAADGGGLMMRVRVPAAA